MLPLATLSRLVEFVNSELRGLYDVRTAIRSTYADHFAIVREWQNAEMA